jgi:hypothetical protein
MALKLITNVGNIVTDSVRTQIYICEDTNQNLLFLAYIKKITTGSGSSAAVTYEMWCINQSIAKTKISTGDVKILDNTVNVSALADGLMLLISPTASNGTGKVELPNFTPTADLYARNEGTTAREIVGSGILLTNYPSFSGGVTTNVPVTTPTTTSNGTGTISTGKTQAQLDAEKAATLEVERSKSILFGVIGGFRSTTGTGSFDSVINWVLDNTYLAIIGFIIAWNYVIVPQFFPTVTFLTWGDTKRKAELLAKKGGKK